MLVVYKNKSNNLFLTRHPVNCALETFENGSAMAGTCSKIL